MCFETVNNHCCSLERLKDRDKFSILIWNRTVPSRSVLILTLPFFNLFVFYIGVCSFQCCLHLNIVLCWLVGGGKQHLYSSPLFDPCRNASDVITFARCVRKVNFISNWNDCYFIDNNSKNCKLLVNLQTSFSPNAAPCDTGHVLILSK